MNFSDTSFQWRSFAFFSANLQWLMPQVPFADHPALFSKANTYRRLATDDELGWERINALQGANDIRACMKEPGIVATFHTGPYRMLTMWLMQQRLPLTLVVSADVARKQGDHNREWHARIAGTAQGDLFETLRAEDPAVLLKMGRALRNGRFVLMYIDGNTGSGGERHGKRNFCLDFLGQSLRVKTGVAELSFLYKVPIYPVLPLFDDAMEPQFRYVKTICPQYAKSRKAYVGQTMSLLYDWLETFLRRHPMQWEGWFYVHHDLQLEAGLDRASFFYHYLPFELNGKFFLLNKSSVTALPIEQKMFAFLKEKFLDCLKF